MIPDHLPANLLTDHLPSLDAAASGEDEQVVDLLKQAGVRVERIVSTGQSSPPGFWYDQDEAEWVLLLSGSAGLRFEDEDKTRELSPGDQVFIAAHRRHRVEWTAAGESTIWVAVFCSPTAGQQHPAVNGRAIDDAAP